MVLTIQVACLHQTEHLGQPVQRSGRRQLHPRNPLFFRRAKQAESNQVWEPGHTVPVFTSGQEGEKHHLPMGARARCGQFVPVFAEQKRREQSVTAEVDICR